MELNLLDKVGPKTINLLNKLNINSIEDILEYYPYRYNVIKFLDIKDTDEENIYYVKATVLSEVKVQYIKKNFNRLTFIASCGNTNFTATIFNRAFLKQYLTVNREIILVGKYKKEKNTFTANDIKFNMETERIEAKYHLTEGIKNSNLEKIVDSALKVNVDVSDYVPECFNKKYNLITKNSAIKKIHQPQSIDDIKKSELKLIYEELFIYMFKMNYLKKINKNVKGLKKEFDKNIVDDFLNSLSFKLTTDQISTIHDIIKDMEGQTRMNRLVLGDVGSGKTIVAIAALLANYLSGYQSSLMAPTEILAEQHYQTIKNYFESYDIKIILITGSLKKKVKEKYYNDIKSGNIDIVVGTHSLLNENLNFKNLGLVITDEQHRFGVNQRNILQNKGTKNKADVLYLSATPIPRTYALSIYGDLDLSQIKTKPNIRKDVITKVFVEKDIRDVLLKMLEELKLGHQIFVVSPLIEQNDELSLNSVLKLEEKLNKAFNGNVNIGILHGKLKSKEKDELMQKFKKKEIYILISTTVIEVGIDIPNASMMVIFNAERFGLATLHQLRGRVGRSDIQSYCYLISNNEENKRLKVMEESNDGFYIAECDFKQRGQGDLFGVKQSGDMIFKIADFARDFKILNQANIDSKEFLESNAYLDNIYYKNIVDSISFLD
jgi:ATP-dependent DNA helicase RecG